MSEFRKVVIIGDGGVGKTSIRTQYIHQRFAKSYKATIGADFVAKQVQVHNKLIALQIWDTAGQERFQSLSSAYYRGSDCCVLVYDVTVPKSLHSLASWIRDFIYQGKIENPHLFLFVLVGNKCDSSDRILSYQQGQKASIILKELIDELADENDRLSPRSISSPVAHPRFPFIHKRKEVTDNELMIMEKSLQSVSLRPLKKALSREHLEMPNRDSVVSFHTALSELDESYLIDQSILEEEGIPFFETSALQGTNIDTIFKLIANETEKISRCQSSATINVREIQDGQIRKKNSCAC
jgi:small GTP-binding protein